MHLKPLFAAAMLVVAAPVMSACAILQEVAETGQTFGEVVGEHIDAFILEQIAERATEICGIGEIAVPAVGTALAALGRDEGTLVPRNVYGYAEQVCAYMRAQLPAAPVADPPAPG